MLKISSSFEQGEILVLELPFSNLVGSKLRPVLVVSNANYNNSSNDVIVAKITGSNFNTPWEIKLTNEHLESGKLKKISFIDTGFLFTIEKSIIKRSIAKIKENHLGDYKMLLLNLRVDL
ncbi:MAG: type II toxin-antitoxin system PemK/MazF family toxin [Candidatus Heimdallarchaeota archaeon]